MQTHVLKQTGSAVASQLETVLAADVAKLKRFLEAGRGNTAVLTGAGISTDSGIPDYRGPNGVYMRNKDFKPLQYQEFAKAHTYRQRYWARSFLGWPKIQHALPNASHDAMTHLQQSAVVSHIMTQNVDRLHSKSGAQDVLELHGCLHEVECVNCRCVTTRQAFQEQLAEMNPKVAQWSQMHPEKDSGDVASSVNPDGDVDITWNYDDFAYSPCAKCGGMMKPKVVFFGENIPVTIKTQSLEHVDSADALLIVGSSLQVFSAMRLLNRARDRNIPVAIVNLGPTRGDDLCDLRLDAPCTDLLTTVVSDWKS